MQPGVFLLWPVELFPARHHQVIVKEVRSEIMEQKQNQTQFSSEESSLLSEEHADLSFGGLLQTPCLSLTTERLLVNCILFYFILFAKKRDCINELGQGYFINLVKNHEGLLSPDTPHF